MPVRQIEDVNLFGILRAEIGVASSTEDDPLSIRRPRKAVHAELIALRQSLRFRKLLRIGRNFGRNFDQPKVVHGVVAANDLEISIPLLTILFGLRLRSGRSEGNRASVR